MKRTILFSMVALLLVACETKAPRQEVDEPDFYYPEEFTEISEINGIVTSVNESEVAIMTEAGDTCTFLLNQAEANHRVLGGYKVNDHVVIVPGNGDSAEELVNLTTLIGRWVRLNVADEESGIHIKEGGVASSINNDTQNFHKWAMHGATLLLTWSGDGSDGTTELIDSCTIRYLSQDTLKFVSNFDTTLEMQYYRQK